MNREEAEKKGYDFYMEDELKDPQENTIENLTDRLNKSKKSRDAFISNIKQKAKCNNLPQEFTGCIPLDMATELLKKMESNHPDLKNVIREARAFLELDMESLLNECKTMKHLEEHLINVITPTPLKVIKKIKDYLIDIESIKNTLPDYDIEPQKNKQKNILKYDVGQYDPKKIIYEPNNLKPIQQLIDLPKPPLPDPIIPDPPIPEKELEEMELKKINCEDLIKNAEEYKMVYRNYELPPLIDVTDTSDEEDIVINIPEEIIPDIPPITIPKIPNINIPEIPKMEICDFDMLTKSEIENMIVKIQNAPKDWCQEIGCKKPQETMVYVCNSSYTVIQMSKEQATASGVKYYDTQSECQNNCKKPSPPVPPPNNDYVWTCTMNGVEKVSKECATKINTVQYLTEDEALAKCPKINTNEPWVYICQNGKSHACVKKSWAEKEGVKYYTTLDQNCNNCPEPIPPDPPPPTNKDVYICAKGPTPKKVKESEAKSLGVDYWDRIHIAQKNCEKMLVWNCRNGFPEQSEKYGLDVTKAPYEFNKEDLDCNDNDQDVWYCYMGDYTVKRTKLSIAKRNKWIYDCCDKESVIKKCKPNRNGWACNDNYTCYQTKESEANKKNHDFYLTANKCKLNCKRPTVDKKVWACYEYWGKIDCREIKESEAKNKGYKYYDNKATCDSYCNKVEDNIVYACDDRYSCYKTNEFDAKNRNYPFWSTMSQCKSKCKRPEVKVWACNDNYTCYETTESEARQKNQDYFSTQLKCKQECKEPPKVMVWICDKNSGRCSSITEDEAKQRKNKNIIDKFYYTEKECKDNCIRPCSEPDFDVNKDKWYPISVTANNVNVTIKNYDSGIYSIKYKRNCKYNMEYKFKITKKIDIIKLPVMINVSLDCSGSMSDSSLVIQKWFNDKVLINNDSKFNIYRQSWDGNSKLIYENKSATQMKNLKLWNRYMGDHNGYDVRVHRCYSIIDDPIIGQGTRTRFSRGLTWVSRGFYEFLKNIKINLQYKNVAVFISDFEECGAAKMFFKDDCLFGTGTVYKDMYSTFKCTTNLMNGIKSAIGNKQLDKLILINFSSRPTKSDFARSENDLKQAMPNIKNIKYYNAYPRISNPELYNIKEILYDIEGNEANTQLQVIDRIHNKITVETDNEGLLKQTYTIPHGKNIPNNAKIEPDRDNGDYLIMKQI
jgi:hypothetical protein